MKRVLATLCICTGCFCTGLAAQPYPEGRRGGPPRGEIFEKTQADLARARQHSYDGRRIERAQREISDFQRKLTYGRFSGRDLDQAIHATDEVVRRGSLAPVDRDILFRDLERMRAFRGYSR